MKCAIFSRLLFAFGLAVVFCVGGALPARAFTPQSPKIEENVYKLMKSHKELSKFVDMIDDADLKDLLTSTDQQVTVFAPNNDAIEDISRGTMNRIKNDKASLQGFVKYHIIAGSVVPSSAIRGRRASPASASGEMLQFDGVSKKDEMKVNDAEIVQADLQAGNGVVHIVSTALVPPSIREEAKKPVAEPVAAAPPPPAPNPVAATTSAAPASAKTTGFITTGVAKAPAASKAATAVTAQPSALPATTTSDSSGFQLFGHKFSW